MNSIKTYNTPTSFDAFLPFGILKMEEMYDKFNSSPDEPHRHDFYTIIFIQQAKGVHNIDFNAYELAANQIYFITPGQVHQMVENEPSKGYTMVFSSQFLVENAISTSFMEELRIFSGCGETPPLILAEERLQKVTFFCDEIFNLSKSDTPMKEQSIAAFLKLLLIECNNIYPPLEINKNVSRVHTIRDFKKLVNIHYTTIHSPSEYAEMLSITPDHLNRMIKIGIGKTTKEYIQAKITTEAKRLLYFSSLSNKEIGYQLGFNEPANFSAFFKKCTGLSPNHFKKQHIGNS